LVGEAGGRVGAEGALHRQPDGSGAVLSALRLDADESQNGIDNKEF